MARPTYRAYRTLLHFGIAASFATSSLCPARMASAQTVPEQPAAAEGTETPAPPRAEPAPSAALLDAGFRDLYQLNFKGGREQFLSYEKIAPNDPMGKAAEAASYLYEQFNAKGIFTSEFFLSDEKFLNGASGTPAQNRNDAFLSANRVAHDMAIDRLRSDPRDREALLVLTITDGMEADYDALIVKKQMAALGLTKQADAEALKLLAIDPSAEDAYMALGAANYIIGCLPGYKRAFLWFGGVHGDRQRGMEQLQRTAEHGHYLQAFAKAWLALACEREHQYDRARQLLSELAAEFPENPLFARELALASHPAATKP
ncbi:MAG TPA: hypothetical protein VEJ38_00255 [Candidatus Acidoferrales bacterium]|nr:hypothetical protein [Candidatus Acidoferrales bacterium]